MISHDDADLLSATLPWRRSVLRHAGFSPGLAATVAADGRYDVDAILGLTEHGCPPELAVRIVAPLAPPRR
jgi:hypothetical protein